MMIRKLTACTLVALLSATMLSTPAAADGHAHGEVSKHVSCSQITPEWRRPAMTDPKEASAEEIGCAVASWQLAAKEDMDYIDIKIPQSSYGRGWVKATFYIGLDTFASAMGDDNLLGRVRQFALENGLELGDRPWHGDDQAVAAVYAAMAMRENEPEYMRKSRERFDEVMAANYTHSLELIEPEVPGTESVCQTRWCWADAIFMAPPAWALATKVSGDPKYLDYAVSETRATIEYLQDPQTGLLFRDSRYFDLKTENGKPVFWSRGNGWVFAGLARFIDAMPQDHPDLPYMKQTYLTLADRLVTLQREDGFWPTSLMDAEYLTNPEASGTGFFGYGLAWGINNGMLQGEQYINARDKAWDAMRFATNSAGKVGWVQQIGKDPQTTQAETSQLYGAGAMLLFASEMLDVETQH